VRRCEFIALYSGAAAWPLAAGAQRATIGVDPYSPPSLNNAYHIHHHALWRDYVSLASARAKISSLSIRIPPFGL
jgi:hypothetical protein